MGVTLKRTTSTESRHLQGKKTSSWEAMPHIMQLAPIIKNFDPLGSVWGRGGHFSVCMLIGSARARSSVGKANKHFKESLYKQSEWELLAKRFNSKAAIK